MSTPAPSSAPAAPNPASPQGAPQPGQQAPDTGAEATPPTPDTGAATPPTPDTGDDELAKWKALARKHETQAKANAEKAKSYDEWQDSQKTEAEKSAQQIADLEKQVAEQQRTILRSQVAAEKGLEPELAETLTGSTADEMRKHADALLAAIKRRYAPKQKPSPDDTGAGAQGSSLQEQIAAAEAKGDFATSMSLKNRLVLDKARGTT